MGIFVPILCWFIAPIDLIEDPLSLFGIDKNTYIIWGLFMQIISFYLFFNSWTFITENKSFNKIQELTLKTLTTSSCSFLSLTGAINMSFTWIHISFAALFFLSYAALVFWTGFFSIKNNFLFARTSITISILMVLSSFLLLLFNGLAPFEIVFILLIIVWNLKISKH